MAFTNDQTGLERGATQLLLTDPPRDMNRHQAGGPQRAKTAAIDGSVIGCEYHQAGTDPLVVWGMETLTDAQAAVLRTLLDGTGVVTAKQTRGTADTFTATFGPEWELEPIIGHFTDTAPDEIRYWRARVELLKQ